MMGDANVFATQVTLGMLGAGFLQLLKKSTIVQAISQHSGSLNHIVLLLTSAAGALSIHFTWNATSHSLVITGLDTVTILSSLWLWAKQWTVQYLVHRGAFGAVSVPPPPPPATH